MHGAEVVTVTAPGFHAGIEADAAVTSAAGCALLIRTADCAPVALWADVGSPEAAATSAVVGLAHAGWRGVEAGVIEATVSAMRALGADRIWAQIGPCIGPECYEFGRHDLDRLVRRFGIKVRSETSGGRPALDLRQAVTVALDRADVEHAERDVPCTACDESQWFSHRARSEPGRQPSFAWLEP